MARRESEGRGVLPPCPHRTEAPDVDVGGLRVDPARQGQGRRRRHAAQSRRGRHVHGVHRGQGVGLPRARSTAHHPRRGRGHGGRVHRLLEAGRPPRVLRRRALLRRLSQQPRVLAPGARRRGHGRRRLPRAVRHQRGILALRRRTGRRRGGRSPRRHTHRYPPPQRHGLRCGQCARRGARRGHPGAGHHQRLRRAGGELRPRADHREPVVEDGHRNPARRAPGAAHQRCAPHRRDRELHRRSTTALCGFVGVRAQGRAAHERDLAPQGRVRAHRSVARG
ncbi:unannotated protein [freshwater metagenome]|uniref:Unannotated protein n=1 Tax=freshwater metagenome TaxID=449393 RepID=A0A6J7G977_9ZZZZ